MRNINNEETQMNPSKYSEYENDFTPTYSKIGDNIAEKVLAIVAYIILFGGIIFSIIAGVELLNNPYVDKWLGLIYLIGGCIASLIIWASLMVTVNISNNLRQIKHELRERR